MNHSWFETKTFYKKLILGQLPDDIVEKFLFVLENNTKAAEWLFQTKTFVLLKISINNFNSLTFKDVKLFAKLLANGITTSEIDYLLQINTNINNITTHNVKDFIWISKNIQNTTEVIWGPGNCDTIQENIESHYKKHVFAPNEIWEINSTKEYEEFAIKHFENVTNKIIHTNGKTVFVSGFYGKYFIIARVDKCFLSISSCYYVESGEKTGRLRGSLLK